MVTILAVDNSHNLNAAAYDSFVKLVSPERNLKAARFIRREDACRSIVGEAIARYCIGRRENVSPSSFAFQCSDNGKPYVDLPGKTQFSISHSKSWVVCAIDCAPVGIDIEHVHDHDSALAKRFFHPDEYAALMYLPEQERKGRFFDLWTLKESYIKAIGKGLSCPLDSFAVSWDGGNIRLTASGNLPAMEFRQYDFGAEYACSACATHNDFPNEIEFMTPEELLNNMRSCGVL